MARLTINLTELLTRAGCSQAVIDVANERVRQVTAEGYTLEHDDEHIDGSIASVASCYALPPLKRLMAKMRFPRDVGRSADEPVIVRDEVAVPINWPQSWHGSAWKARDRRRELVIAGALILAEIERIDRAARRTTGREGEPR